MLKRRFSLYFMKKCHFGIFFHFFINKIAKTAFSILLYENMLFWPLFINKNAKTAFFTLFYEKMQFQHFFPLLLCIKSPKQQFPYYFMKTAVSATFFMNKNAKTAFFHFIL
jgi:hypothetical protein